MDKKSGKKCIVIKIGSSTITSGKDFVDTELIKNLALQASNLYNNGWKVVIVSSGAVSLGMPRMKNCNINSILCKQRAAARGQPLLMAGWNKVFNAFDIDVDQLLFNKRNFIAHIAILKAIDDGIVIANGDDTGNDPTTEEIVIYEDNDDLAADIAIALKADIIVYLTDVPGILDKDGNSLEIVWPFEDLTKKGVVYNGKNKKGTGGIESKHWHASRAAEHGILTIIAHGKEEEVLYKVTRQEQVGSIYALKQQN